MVVASASTRVAGASSPRVAGALTRVLVSLEGVADKILLGAEQVDVSVSVGVQSGLEIDPAEFTFGAGKMSQELELELAAFLPLAVQRDDLQLQLLGTMPDTLCTTIPPSATLPVRVLREFTISFATLDGAPLEITTPPDNAGPRATTLRILVGGSRELVLVLDNPELLGVGEKFLFDLLPPLPNGRVSSGQTLEPGDKVGFSTDLHSNVPLQMVTLGLIDGKVVSKDEDGDYKEVLHTRVVPVSLRVEFVPRRFRLSLSPAGVVQFSRTERPNEAIPDNTAMQSVRSTITVAEATVIKSLEVRVEISHLDIGDLRVLLVSPEGVVVALHDRMSGSAENLFETYTSLDHAGLAALVGVPAQGEWTLTVGDYNDGETGTLEAWSLEINGFARVLAGGSAAVTASLVAVETPLGTPQLFANEMLAGVGPEVVEVVLAYDDGTGVALSEQMVTFTAGRTAVDVTLDALLDATRGTLTAVAGAISVNAEIAPAALRIEVLPNEFRLVFEPPQIGILTGMTETVVLSLTDASRLPAGDEVLVGLRLDDASTVSVMSPTELSFDASATSHVVVLRAAADTSPGATVLVASVEMSPASLAGAEFMDAGLPVSIIGAREFEWVFRSPQGERLSTAMVIASASTQVDGASLPRVTGASTRLLVSLEGVAGESLFGDEQVKVNVSVSAGAQSGLEIDPTTLTFRAGEMSQELELELTALLPLAVQRDDLQLQLLETVPSTLRTTIPSSATLPVQVLREFTISFATRDGTPLEITTSPDNTSRGVTTVQILSGGDRTVMWVLDNPEFLDTELLGGDEKFLFDLLPPLRHGRVQSGQNAEPGDVFTFSMEDRSDLLPGTVQLRGLLAGRVVLESDGKEVLHTRVVPITLRVEIAPRRFRLSLSPAGIVQFSRTERPNEAIPDTFRQSVQSAITVGDEITIESLAVRVEIRHSFIGDLRVFLVSPKGAVVALHDEAGGSAENLFETYTSLDHAGLVALVGAPAQGVWTLSVGDYADGNIGTLEAWSLEINGFAPVLAGGSVSLVASLTAIRTPPLGIPRVFAGEELEVVLAYNDGTGVALSTQRVTFDADLTPVGVTLDALFNATRGTLTAVVAGAISVNAEIASAALPVEIAPRRFRLSLSSAAGKFSRTVRPNELIPDDTGMQSVRSVITVEDEITIESLTVQVEILHPFIGDLRVFLVSPEGEAVALHDRAGGSAENLFETYTSLDHAGLAALVGAPAQGEWTLTVDDYLLRGEIGTLEAWSLQINTGVQVIAGESIPVVATLSGVDTPFGASRLFAGETLTVDWTYTDGVGVTLSPVVFDVTSPTSSVEVASILSATSTATAGVLEAIFDAAAGLVNATVDPQEIPVIVVRRFRLAFVPATTARVLAGGATEVEVVLENAGLLREGETLQVTLRPTTATVIPLELTLTADEESTIFTIVAPFDAVPPLGMVVATGKVLLLADGTAVAHTRVGSTTLAVEIVPRAFTLALAFDLASVSVVAGATTQVTLTLTGDTELIGEDEAVEVTFAYDSSDPAGGGVEVVALGLVMFTAGSTAAVVMLEAATTATDGVLTASVPDVAGVTVAPATLGVEIVPRAFTLAFDLASVSVVAGATAQVTLTLTGATELIGDEVFAATFTYAPSDSAGGGGVDVVALEPMMFTRGSTAAVVTLEAATTATDGVLEASVLDVDGAGAAVAPATLGVEIVPRVFALAFDLASVSVVAGATTQVTLTLTGATELIGDDVFAATFTYAPSDPAGGGGVDVVALEPMMFTAGSTAVVVTLEAATTATDGELEASVLDVDGAGAAVAPATLGVGIVPRVFALAFDASMVSVIAGATTQVTLTLTGATELIGDEVFAATFTYAPSDPAGGGGVDVVALEPMMFTAGSTAVVVTLEARRPRRMASWRHRCLMWMARARRSHRRRWVWRLSRGRLCWHSMRHRYRYWLAIRRR